MRARSRSGIPTPGLVWGLGWLLCLLATQALSAPSPPLPRDDSLPLLTTIGQVRALSPEEAARGYPVRVQGTVTYYGSTRLDLFIQDSSDAIFVYPSRQGLNLRPGQRVMVEGSSSPGKFAPIIAERQVTVLGEGELPAAQAVSSETLLTGQYDSHLVQIQGVARSATAAYGQLMLEVQAQDRPVEVWLADYPEKTAPAHLVDAQVRVTGVCAIKFNTKRQLIGVTLMPSSLSQIQVTAPALTDPFALPVRPVRTLAVFTTKKRPEHRVRVQGIVTLHQPGQGFHLRDETGCLFVGTADSAVLNPGQKVDAVGFLGVLNFSPALERASIRLLEAGPAPKPVKINSQQALSGDYDGDLVELEATLLTRAQHQGELLLSVQSEDRVFDARLRPAPPDGFPNWLMPGSRLRVTGICTVLLNGLREPTAFNLTLRSRDDLVVTSQPAWWTRQYTLRLMGGMAVVILAVLLWVHVLRRRVGEQTALIREQVAREAALERKLLDAQKLESLGVMAGGIAHDFNNLLTAILGNAGLAGMELPETSPVRDYLANIEKTCRQAAELCKQMLAYSGRGRFQVQPLDLNALLQDLRHLIEASVSKKCQLRLELAHPAAFISADPAQMRQLIMNLAINAAEAIGGKNGSITLATATSRMTQTDLAECYLAPELPAGDYVELTITDTGCGMSPEVKAKMFDPFFSSKFTGRGLGMPAVLGIVRGHQGAIKVESEEGRGTTVRLFLPERKSSVTKVDSRPAPPASGQGAGTVLVVDDEDAVRLVAAGIIKSSGFKVLTASDGLAGVAVFREHAEQIALVLLDLTMPKLNGEETFRELRAIRAEVPVLLMSGYSEQDAQDRFASGGLAGFIQKPFAPADLRAKLRSILGEQLPAPQAQVPPNSVQS